MKVDNLARPDTLRLVSRLGSIQSAHAASRRQALAGAFVRINRSACVLNWGIRRIGRRKLPGRTTPSFLASRLGAV
jgi:hypothetical protein